MYHKKRWYFDAVTVKNLRKSNMDSILLKERIIGGTPIIIAAVCDGVGSLKDGGIASSEAVRLLDIWFDNLKEVNRVGLELLQQVLYVNNQVNALAEERGIKTASTASVMVTAQDKYYIVHLGDSRIYTFDDERIEQLTPDQIEGGKLLYYIGCKENIRPFYSEGQIDGRSFFLCSDGLYKLVDQTTLLGELKYLHICSIKRIMKRLINLVVRRGENDNISIVILYQKRQRSK